MTLKELIESTEMDYDVYDTEYDMSITCCDIYPLEKEQEEEYYYKMIDKIYAEAEVISHDDSCVATANWTGWIEDRKEKLAAFVNNHWGKRYSDDDFYEQWIREIHLYFAGYADEATYKMFYEEVLA